MAIFRHTSDLPPEVHGAVIAIGNFDGVHLGHQAVIAEARDLARAMKAPLAVLTFEPHPRSVFQPDAPPFRLTPLRIKARALEDLGVQHLIVLRFDTAFSKTTAEAFVHDILVKDFAVRHVVVGWDYRFGHRRAGDAALLDALGADLGFGVTALRPIPAPDGGACSASRIRRLLQDGLPLEAAELLGRLWEIEGRVEHGDGRGLELGFPTANIGMEEYLVPALGVYAVRAGVDRGSGTVWLDGAANLGRRPTFGGTRLLLEVHLLDFAGDLYGHHLRVRLVDRLREEKKFDGLEALQAQIADDCGLARAVLARDGEFGQTPAAAGRSS